MKATALAQWFVEQLQKLACAPIVVCSGARNAVLVKALQKQNMEFISFMDEGSAAYYAVGAAMSGQRPVVITSSGTAAAQLLPACIEAYYQDLSLLLVTADRPKSYRGSGAPQSIEQKDLFGPYAGQSFDWDEIPNQMPALIDRKPLHFNLCFASPREDQAAADVAAPQWQWAKSENRISSQTFSVSGEELVIISRLQAEERGMVLEFLRANRLPVYLEASSGLTRQEIPSSCVVLKSGEALAQECMTRQSSPRFLHLGGVPTTRIWRDLAERGSTQGLSLGGGSFSGIPGLARYSSREAWQHLLSYKGLLYPGLQELETRDEDLYQRQQKIISAHPRSEHFLYQQLASQLGSDDSLYLGNSMPIRMWDRLDFPRLQAVACNRGANGIDGQLSSFFGVFGQGKQRAVAILGDLTLMYDLNAFWAEPYLRNPNLVVVVINNGGGMIFKRTQSPEAMLARHSWRFAALTEMFPPWRYCSFTQDPQLPEQGRWLVEILPDEDETDAVWRALESL